MFQIFLQPTAFIATIIVLYLHFDRKKLNFKEEMLFFHAIMFNLMAIIAETIIISCAAYFENASRPLVSVTSIIYGLSILLEFYLINRFLYVRLKSEFNIPGKIVNIFPMLIFITVTVIYPVEVRYEDGIFDAVGIPVYCLGILMIFYGVVAVVRVFDRALFEKASHKTVFFYSFFAILCGLALIFVRGTLFTGAIMSFVLWLLYCRFDNPEQYLDRVSNVFNHETFYIVMNERLRKKQDCTLITFSLREFPMLTEVFGLRAIEHLIVDIMDYFSKYAGKYIFRLETNLFCLCIDRDRDCFDAVTEIQKRFEDNWEIGGLEVTVKPALSLHRSILGFSGATELEEAVTFFAVEGRKKEDTPILIVDDNLLEERRKFMDMQRVLEKAISGDEIEVYYQPIYSVKSGKYVALEALARLRAENGELLCAEEFINYAEAGYKLVKMGDAIFRKVCRFARSFDFEANGIEYITVNLSKVQCLQENLAYDLNLIMSEYNIPPYRMRFEVQRPDGAAIAVANLRELAKYGSGVTLDKCTLGFSGRLIKNESRFSQVKLDVSLFKEYLVTEELRRPLEDTVKMLHSLNFEVAVSSVENMEQYGIMKDLGVEYIQGFYLSDALSSDKAQKFIQEWL